MADTTRDVVVRLALKQSDAKIKPPDIAPAKRAVDAYDAAIERTNKHIKQTGASTAEIVERAERRIREATKAINEQETAAQNAAVAAQEFMSFIRTLGESSLKVARAIGFLTASNEKNLRVMLRKLVVIQATYDGLSAVWNVVVGVRGAYQSLAIAIHSSTIAMKAFQVASGPIGWIVLGITAGVTALGAAYHSAAIDAEESASRQQRALERLKTFHSQQKAPTSLLAREAEMATKRRLGRVTVAEERQYRFGIAAQLTEAEKDPTRHAETQELIRQRATSPKNFLS